jgi:hypothetical protein
VAGIVLFEQLERERNKRVRIIYRTFAARMEAYIIIDIDYYEYFSQTNLIISSNAVTINRAFLFETTTTTIIGTISSISAKNFVQDLRRLPDDQSHAPCY